MSVLKLALHAILSAYHDMRDAQSLQPCKAAQTPKEKACVCKRSRNQAFLHWELEASLAMLFGIKIKVIRNI
eukprot:1159871-Pelagomonas_calceolata.AAC.5